ncbi:MAG TPA: DALR anticodon-binding domain-containing protein [Streptosporangiaceae bacterium]|nr:DALR anticodon-binding domain-containing protein [Streptosporangiaceae bacterium]
MLTADLRHAVLAAARNAGFPTPDDDPVLRPGGAPGRYRANLPLRIAAATGQPAGYPAGQPAGPDAATVAATIAAELQHEPWIAQATPAPQGHLIITVTDDALARLAVRVTEAGPDCARSDALKNTTPTPPRASPDGPWADAHSTVRRQVTASLATAAGASVPSYFHGLISGVAQHRPGAAGQPPEVQQAVTFAGPDAVRYTLARTPAEHLVPPDQASTARHIEANPAYAVRYAYSCAASTLRWAADLGLSRGPAEQFRPGSLTHPRERALLDALSWLPEQVARAARRGRPHEFTAFCEELAETYQVCRVTCPAWPERGHVVRARLWLTGAVAAGLAAGLELLGVSAPGRL